MRLFKIHLQAKTGERGLSLSYQPREHQLARKYFALVESFLQKGKQLDAANSYWYFGLASERKREYVNELIQRLETLKLDSQFSNMQYTIDESIDQDLLNRIHSDFETHLNGLNSGRIKTSHWHEVTRALLRINLLIHMIENYHKSQREIRARNEQFLYCSFGFRFDNDEFHNLADEDYAHWSVSHPFGTMCLGYNTTGKNMLHAFYDGDADLVVDRKLKPQRTFSTEAFVPFSRDSTEEEARAPLYAWWDKNDWNRYGYDKQDQKNVLGLFGVADLLPVPEMEGMDHYARLQLLDRFSGIAYCEFTNRP